MEKDITRNVTYGTIVERPLWSKPVQIFADHPLPDGGLHIVGALASSQTPINQEIIFESSNLT